MHINSQKGNVEFHTNIFLLEDESFRDIKDWKGRLSAIIEQIPGKADTLTPIIQFLVMTVAPTKIYLMNHKSIVSQPTPAYLDLLLVIPGSNHTTFQELEPILEIPYIKDSRVVCSLHNEGVVAQALGNGHIFYAMNFTRENLIYEDKANNYPDIPADVIQEIKQRARAQFFEHFERSVDFYASAEALHQRKPARIIAFLLHQAVEFCYRGVLISLNGYEKRTHEIHVLKKHTRRCAPQLSTIFSSDEQEEKRLTELLNSAYLSSRYESNYEINENDLNIIFDKVKALQDVCKELVEIKTDTALKNEKSQCFMPLI
jgi:HEPN domain-containing protein